MSKHVFAALLGAAALAVPTAAAADPGHGKGHEKRAAKEILESKGAKAKNRTYVFKGSFAAPGTVEVRSGNAHVRKGGFVGQTVTFDFASAKIVAADGNADQTVDLSDVKDGDLVLVQARLAKGADHVAAAAGETAEPLAARKLIDKTNPPVED
jgi:hypothetical protein